MRFLSLRERLGSLRRPTLRLRMTLWTAALLVLTAAVLVVFIAVGTNFGVRTVVLKTVSMGSEPGGLPKAERVGGLQVALPISPPADPRQEVLGQIRRYSLIGLGLVIIFGTLGTYWVTGMALRPVHELSERMRGIDSRSLAARLPENGPEDELKQLTRAFNGMLERLERAFEQQKAFAQDSAHELRTPLAILRTGLEVVSSDPDVTVEDFRANVRIQERALRRLEAVVDDLLLLAQAENLPVVEEVALGAVLEEVRADLQPLAEARGVTVQLTGNLDTHVQGDASLLTRAFSNLVDNAIRYNRDGGQVTIIVIDEGSAVSVRVVDQGVGIPAADLPRVFERFYRVDRSRARHSGGSGLGLSIVRHVVRQHRGEVQVTSEVGVGSTFTVRLPRTV